MLLNSAYRKSYHSVTKFNNFELPCTYKNKNWFLIERFRLKKNRCVMWRKIQDLQVWHTRFHEIKHDYIHEIWLLSIDSDSYMIIMLTYKLVDLSHTNISIHIHVICQPIHPSFLWSSSPSIFIYNTLFVVSVTAFSQRWSLLPV